MTDLKTLFNKQYTSWLNEGRSLTSTIQIPHIIHHIWIGSTLPEKYNYFIESFKKNNPDWKHILWTESEILSLPNFTSRNAFINSKSFGVKSDIARYEILKEYGGFYFDTDFECISSLNEISANTSFITCIQEQDEIGLGNAMLGAIPHHPIISIMCKNIKAVKTSEMMDIINSTGPGFLTKIISENLDLLSSTDVILPHDYFFPVFNFNSTDLQSPVTKSKHITKNTIAIHYWEQSWFDYSFTAFIERKIRRAIKKIKKLFIRTN